MNEQMREEFLAAFEKEFGVDVEEFADTSARKASAGMAIWAWGRSRAALLVDLPSLSDESFRDEYPDVEGGAFNEVRYADAVKGAIRAAGIKIKGDAE